MITDSECCKAGRVAAKYGFTEKLANRLGPQWEDADGPGVRKLARQFNILVINTALLDAGEPALDGEAELLYRLLMDDEVEEAERARACQRLDEWNIDADALTGDFISYKTINRHFKNCTKREREHSAESHTTDGVLNRVNALKRRLEKVTERSISEIASHAAIGTDGSDLDVIVQVNIVCPECDDRLPIRELLADGCSCADATQHKVSQTP